MFGLNPVAHERRNKTTWIAVRFKEPCKRSGRSALATNHKLNYAQRNEVQNEKYTLLPVAKDELQTVLKNLQSEQDVERVVKVDDRYSGAEERLVFATDRIIVGFSHPPEDIYKTFPAGYKCEQLYAHDPSVFVVQLPPHCDPSQECKKVLQSVKDVKYAEEDWVTVGTHVARPPILRATTPLTRADPILPQQYAPKITKAVDAWDLQDGDPAIKIAILDEGVDTKHEDLAAAIQGHYDATDNDEFQEPNSWDGHGTSCAGLAAAVHNNLGVRGIGSGCSLVAIRIAYSRYPDGPWSTTDSKIAKGIEWAWKTGKADVLSCSWGGGSPSTTITNAFENARKKGRAGKGCVIVIAAGNDNSKVSYPATIPNVLAVSASNEYDEPKTPSSRDGEYWWGSNFGKEVSVAAPGVHNYTTDITGTAGYVSTNYIPDFNGTSSATPIVAGAVGLVLSCKPNLHEDEVRQIITKTADKIGGVTYDSQGRNDRMGYGRLNVYKAIKLARQHA